MGRISRNRAQQNDLIDNDWRPAAIDNTEEMTLLSAVCQIVSVVRGSHFDKRIFELAARPIGYISSLMGFTEREVVVYAIIMDIYFDRSISTYDVGRCLDLPPLKAMAFHKEMEELCKRHYITVLADDESLETQYSVTPEAITSLKANAPLDYKPLVINNAEDWFAALDDVVVKRCHEKIDYGQFTIRCNELLDDNKQLHFVKRFEALTADMDGNDRMLLLWWCNMIVSDSYKTIAADDFRKLYDNMVTYRAKRKALSGGTHIFIKEKLFQVANSSDPREKDCYEPTSRVVEDLLEELNIELAVTIQKDIIRASAIVPKSLYYNAREQQAIDRLSTLLQPERFNQVQSQLVQQGMRSGFACLFYGAPGTGKTETVLQLARATGRDIMQVNISEIKGMWVGESEKNIKEVFTRYRQMVKSSDLAPILLFNEADALIGKRLENVTRSVDKMENAMQNIILEEIERLDGILIATTNLTCNLDRAFERRFLYKIEFSKPTVEVKASIWQSMISELSAEDALTLASKYDFSGGQIENIARKSVVDNIITGNALSLDSLCYHCDTELIDKTTTRKPIGFISR